MGYEKNHSIESNIRFTYHESLPSPYPTTAVCIFGMA